MAFHSRTRQGDLRGRVALLAHGAVARGQAFAQQIAGMVYCQDEPMELTTRRVILERLNLRLCDFCGGRHLGRGWKDTAC